MEMGAALLRRWASLSPGAAAGWVESLPQGMARETAVQQVALVWAESDFDAAWNWTSELGGGPAADSALLSLAYELSRSDPQGAFEKSGALPEGPERSRLVEHIVANWAATAPELALDQVRAIGNPSLRNSALGSLAIGLAEHDPYTAATLVAESMDAGPAQDRAIAAVVQRWAQQDAAAAGEWVASFPDGPIKENALEHAAKQSPPRDE